MRKRMLLSAAALSVALIAGCGGSGAPVVPPPTVTRVLVGYVYVTKNDGGTYTGPATAFILPHNNLRVLDPTPGNPESGDEVPIEKPTAGSVRLTVDGTITRAITSMDFSMTSATGNEIICSVTGTPNDDVTLEVVGGDPLMNGAVAKALSPATQTANLGTADNTVLGVQSPSTPTYTPGAPDEVRVRLQTTKGPGGTASLGTFDTAAAVMASNGTNLGAGFVAGQVYNVAAAVFDKNGIVITGAATTLATSDATRVTVLGNTLTGVSGSGVASGDVIIDVNVTGATLVHETFHGNFNQGSAKSVTVAPAGPTNMLWAAAGVEATQVLTATVKNEVGVAFPGAALTWTSNKANVNDWNTGAFNSVTNVFTPNSGNTANDGTLATTVTAPTSTGALAPGNAAKGLAVMTATCGTATGTAQINITRPFGAINIAGPARLDVGSTSPVSGTNSYRVTGCTDIDGDAVATPAVTWARANTAGAGNVGNTGDTSPQSTSVSTINAGTGVVTAGGIAGQVTVTATDGVITSNTVTTQIFGVPTKMVFAPNTVASVIAGASGEYAGAANTTQAFSFTLIDAYGHTVPFAELTALTTTSSISSPAAGSITQGGLNQYNFTLTFGSSDGTFTIGSGAFTWTGTAGGTPTALGGITRTAGANGS